jgi:hypothetical protein
VTTYTVIGIDEDEVDVLRVTTIADSPREAVRQAISRWKRQSQEFSVTHVFEGRPISRGEWEDQ